MELHVGQDAVGVQFVGDHNTIIVGSRRPAPDPRHIFKARPTNERELLLTELRATDLVGRDGDLAELAAWLASPKPMSCRCVIGRAGAGKTRLAIEACERAAANNWRAGFLRHAALSNLAAEHGLDSKWAGDMFLVVDYAAASAAVLRKWLEALARQAPTKGKLRLLLLERHADTQAGWWADLIRPGSLTARGPDALLDPPTPVTLPSLRRVEDRRALLAQTMNEAARIAGRPFVPPPSPGANAAFDRTLGDDSIDNEPLYLLMAGLVAVTTGAPAALTYRSIELALRVADAERNRLDRLAEGAGIDAAVFRHMAACVTLQGGCTRHAASRLIEEERAALGAIERSDALLRLLATALPLPGTGDIDAIRPVLIGEALLWQHLTSDWRGLDEQNAIVGRAFARAGMPVVTTVIHAAQDLADGSAEHASVAWLAGLADAVTDVGTLMTIANELPDMTLALRERASDINQKIADILRSSTADDLDALFNLAISLNNVSMRLSELGQRTAALAPIQESVRLYRELVQTQHFGFQHYLATALNNLSRCYHDLGQLESALITIEEATKIFQNLVEIDPISFRPTFALLLNNLSNRQSDLGQHEQALVSVAKAVKIRRTLAKAFPTKYLPFLASSLNNYSSRLFATNRSADALIAISESVNIYRELAVVRSDTFKPNLALILNNYSIHLSGAGFFDEALRASLESIAILEQLAGVRPDAFRPDLAVSLFVLADLLDEVGEPLAGVTVNATAIATIADMFVRLPYAFLQRMQEMVKKYFDRCAKLQLDPERTLLAPILPVLERLQQQQEPPP